MAEGQLQKVDEKPHMCCRDDSNLVVVGTKPMVARNPRGEKIGDGTLTTRKCRVCKCLHHEGAPNPIRLGIRPPGNPEETNA